jgi:hypothetical protein
MSELIRYSVVDTVNAKRAMGINDEQIAYVLNLSPNQVRAIPYPKPNTTRAKSVQHMQLQVMVSKLMPRVEAGDREAMLTMLKVQRREADLLGLDAPKEQINRNFNMEGDDLKNLSTEQIKKMILEQIESETIDVTPEPAPEPPKSTT